MEDMKLVWGALRQALQDTRSVPENISRVVWLLAEYKRPTDEWDHMVAYVVESLEGYTHTRAWPWVTS
jgi:hypothetical protein